MPIYEYRCASCSESFEALMQRAGEADPACPRCGSGRVERLLSSFAVLAGQPEQARGPCGSQDCACRKP